MDELVVFGVSYNPSDKVGKTEKQIRDMYGKIYHAKVMDEMIRQLDEAGQLKKPKAKKSKEDEEHKEGGE